MAHSKLSNVCEEPRIATWKAWPAGPLHEDAPERGRELDPSRFMATPTRRLGLMSFARFGGQVDYAACLIRAALSNSPGLKYPNVECLRSWL